MTAGRRNAAYSDFSSCVGARLLRLKNSFSGRAPTRAPGRAACGTEVVDRWQDLLEYIGVDTWCMGEFVPGIGIKTRFDDNMTHHFCPCGGSRNDKEQTWRANPTPDSALARTCRRSECFSLAIQPGLPPERVQEEYIGLVLLANGWSKMPKYRPRSASPRQSNPRSLACIYLAT